MKKLISVLLATVMLVMCLGTTCFAAPTATTFNSGTISSLIDMLDRHMPEGGTPNQGQQRRVEVFNILALYLENDNNIDILIDIFETLTGPSDTVPGGTIGETTLNNIIANLGTTLVANKEAILFSLDVIKALPQEKRAAAIADFRAAQETVDQASTSTWLTEAEAGVLVNNNASFQTALLNVYNAFVGNEGDPAEDGTDKLATHGIGPNTILRLSKAFQGSLVLTDASEGSADFAVQAASDAFKTGLYTSVSEHFTSINGNSVTTGGVVLDEMIDALNGFPSSVKMDMKTVLGAPEIALYVPFEAEEEGGGHGSSTVGGGGLKPQPGVQDKFTPVTSEEPQAPAAAEAAYIYTDTEDHWAQDYIAELSKRGIFNGYADGSFKPDIGITREEIAVALTRALGLENQAKFVKDYRFADSSYISLWAVDSVNMMVKMGVFEGYDDGEYKPKRIITREEMIAVIMRMFSSDLVRAELTYTDHEHIGDWAREYLEKATNMSIVDGYPDGTFRPANSITRAEAAKILYNFMHYAGLL